MTCRDEACRTVGCGQPQHRRGGYADPSLPRDHILRCRAAALLMPPEAALGGRSASSLLGAPLPAHGDPVTVLLPQRVKWAGPAGVRVHRAGLAPADVQENDDGLRYTAPVRTAWDVAALEPTSTAVGVLDAMLRAGRLADADLRRLERSGRGRWGS